MRLIFSLFCVWFAASSPFAWAQSASLVSNDNTPVETVEVEATLHNRGSSTSDYYSAEIDLPPLKVATHYEVRLILTNPYADEIEFLTAVANCGCASIQMDEPRFPSRKPVTIIAKLETPKQSLEGRVSFGFNMFADEAKQKLIGMVNAHSNLYGNLAINKSRLVYEVTEDLQPIQIPLNISAPVSFEKLEVSKSGSLRDVSLELVEGNKTLMFTYH